MNREILFKAKRKDNGEWVEGYYIYHIKRTICPLGDSVKSEDEQHVIMQDSFSDWNMPRDTVVYEINPDTICQYTGLTDKNGQKIWENDIVSNEWCFSRGKSIVKFGEYKDYHMPERYQCGNYGFFLEHMHQNDFGVRKDILYFSCKCEVVGNIFDDADLLEVE